MSKKLLILGRDFHPDKKETATEIYSGLLPYIEPGYTLDLGYYADLLFDITSNDISITLASKNIDLREFNMVLMTNWFSEASIRKDMAYAIGLYLEANKVAFFNTESRFNRSSSKLSQMLLAALHGIPIPRTLFSLSYDDLSTAVQRPDGLPAPFILKDARASRGKGNYLISSYEELSDHRHEHTELHPFIAQSYIASDGSDYRFFVAGGHPDVVLQRIGDGQSHLTNTSAGATAKLLRPAEFSDDVLALVGNISKALHREVTGVDVIFDKATGEPYFLEANPIPQIATGSSPSIKLKALAAAMQRAADGQGDR